MDRHTSGQSRLGPKIQTRFPCSPMKQVEHFDGGFGSFILRDISICTMKHLLDSSHSLHYPKGGQVPVPKFTKRTMMSRNINPCSISTCMGNFGDALPDPQPAL